LKPLTITHAVTRDAGGGGRAARRLHDGLRRIDVNSTLYVRGTEQPDPSVAIFQPSMDFPSRLRRWLRRRRLSPRFREIEQKLGPESPWTIDDLTIDGLDVIRQAPESDIVNLHSLYNFIDLPLFFSSRRSTQPVVWTLHDMVAFTGGCIYAGDCDRFHESCGQCPILSDAGISDHSRDSWRRKRAVFRKFPKNRLSLVTPSHWLCNKVKASSLLGDFSVTTIPYGLDLDAYSPRDKAAARDALGIPQDARVALFVTQFNISNPRKGFHKLEAALKQIAGLDRLLIMTVGKSAPSADLECDVLHLGGIANERLQSIIYSAADLFLIPSLEDNLPLVVQESMACGTPVVGFATGGIPELVNHSEHGLLVKTGDVGALADSITTLLKDDARRNEMGRRCRESATARFSLEVQAAAYRDLYESLLH
jgi:glycosyltransferase involved in cell wall biosynthesis